MTYGSNSEIQRMTYGSNSEIQIMTNDSNYEIQWMTDGSNSVIQIMTYYSNSEIQRMIYGSNSEIQIMTYEVILIYRKWPNSFPISGIWKQTYDTYKLSRILWYYGIVGAVTERLTTTYFRVWEAAWY